MKTLHAVLASDGSRGALNAAEWLAQHFDPDTLKVTVATVEHIDLPAFMEPSAPDAYEALLKEAQDRGRRQAERALEETVQRLAAFSPATVVLNGPPVEAILRYVDQHRPDFVVMGRRGHTLLQSLLIGSVSLGVLQRASVPVLVVEPRAE
ncbi:MAG: universal stress protein [Firmicutes bacterium]|nr:universal stress protein [Alicyclobacillaceae bacterium]MCL6497351.1 universal stress protein [Bacillota bacterium]